jgi:hypothetical protein
MDEYEERCEDAAYPERRCRVEGDAIAGSETLLKQASAALVCLTDAR